MNANNSVDPGSADAQIVFDRLLENNNKVMGEPFLPPLAAMGAAMPFDPFRFMEACVAKSLTSAVVGGAMGGAMGLIIGSYSSITPPVTLPGVPDPPKIPMKHQLREAWTSTGRRCRRWGKNFAMVTAVFSGVECCVEKYRAKHDLANGVIGGCATGAILAAGQGPGAMCFGCVGFAAFSAAIESLMGNH
uniref:Mitochondrial import inner membrane translocase subunit TIM22 n=1 Tax=Aplanochytrium stocchinoi TaxID=215587 RepID=A0A6S8BLG5_9STRA|mmetsp:Transcript_13499/g.15382  ORF Transcript_13499/g.15382 Transcript_13499/m.15382 type:complete len:190 (-) Transcript_13499:917-1486(-)|eukprot:CAMPEP_0204826838 /NCGR_PEP_ID=MMETSP1346-20131115/4453_1 /ASSEMBLY_ACC=CAM_ASM_000771 /TAXON_ID=215587 /ORGANISM="Aplanochytrium stocchinoi, Strain GSBS06" /LENGTH=189 /DNA_ID=CAMNT_0051955043 /DNA_START=30 /DNA_END=599 /DNA_ORIENTATION=-